jgi:hypothetical protein
MKDTRRGRRGNTIVEFTLVGIPMVFVLISVFEIARGMWVYETLAHAVREGTRYAIVNGKDCAAVAGCAVTIGDIAERIRWSAVGLTLDELEVRLQAVGPSGAVSTVPNADVNCTPLRTCLGRTNLPADQWPPVGANRPKVHSVVIQGTVPFRSAIAMLWPGAGRGKTFGRVRLPANSMEMIQF